MVIGIDPSGKLKYPKQEVGADQKHGYIGEDTGEVEVIAPTEAGNSNAAPDVVAAEGNVQAAKFALARAEKALEQAKGSEKPTAATTPAASKPETPPTP